MLREAVEIPSVSGDAEHRPEVFRMADWLQARLEKLEVKVTRVELPKHMCDGQEIPLPPVLFGQYGDDPSKKTILTYGHMVSRRRPSDNLILPRTFSRRSCPTAGTPTRSSS